MKANAKLNPKGKVEIGGLVDGKQMKGESLFLNQETLDAGATAAADALNKQNIPRENWGITGIIRGSNPHHHEPTDKVQSYAEEDFRFGFTSAKMTLGALGQLAGVTLAR